jgi:subtilase family serine protease
MNFIIKLLKFVESLHYIISQIYHLGIPYMKAILKSSKIWSSFKYLRFTKTILNSLKKYLNKIKLRIEYYHQV